MPWWDAGRQEYEQEITRTSPPAQKLAGFAAAPSWLSPSAPPQFGPLGCHTNPRFWLAGCVSLATAGGCRPRLAVAGAPSAQRMRTCRTGCCCPWERGHDMIFTLCIARRAPAVKASRSAVTFIKLLYMRSYTTENRWTALRLVEGGPETAQTDMTLFSSAHSRLRSLPHPHYAVILASPPHPTPKRRWLVILTWCQTWTWTPRTSPCPHCRLARSSEIVRSPHRSYSAQTGPRCPRGTVAESAGPCPSCRYCWGTKRRAWVGEGQIQDFPTPGARGKSEGGGEGQVSHERFVPVNRCLSYPHPVISACVVDGFAGGSFSRMPNPPG